MFLVANRLDGLKCHLVVGTEVGLGPGEIVLDGDLAFPNGAQQPTFSADVYCGQTSGWINMPPGTEVGLGSATLC